MQLIRTLALGLIFIALGHVQSAAADLRIAPMIRGLDEPWGFDFLPDGSVLVTEIDGRLLRWQNGRTIPVDGAPEAVEKGQGGLLDLTVAKDFATSRTVWMTYTKRIGGGIGTALAAAELSEDGARLLNLRDLFVMTPGTAAGRHFGSRVVEAGDGTLFVTIGDRGARPEAQNRENHIGSIIRINRDGTIPDDNPFTGGSGLRPEIWSYGHRNPQGAGLDMAGRLWTAEHGARGGDEINLIRKGANYGWPVISYGRHYSGGKIGEGTAKPGMEQPAHYWDPSIAPSGLMVYTGDMFPQWRGDMFVGSLKFDYISRLDVSGDKVREVGQIRNRTTERVRDINEAPDGSIWFISVGNGTIYRISQ